MDGLLGFKIVSCLAPNAESRVQFSRQGSSSSRCFGSNTSQKSSLCQKAGGNLPELLPKADPFPWRRSSRAKANQTNRSPQLAFAAAIVAASLQLFTLPGLAIERQQNLTQPVQINANIIEEQNKRLDGLLKEVQKINESEDKTLIIAIEGLGAFLSLISAIGVILISISIDKLRSESKTLNNRLEEIAKSDHQTKSILGEYLMELGKVGKALTEK